MPQDPTQLDPGFDYAKLPDGSYAKFAKGTSQDAMRAKLTQKGLLKPTATKPSVYPTGVGSGDPNTDTRMLSSVVRQARPTIPRNYGFTAGNMLENFGQGVNDIGGFFKGAVTHPINTLQSMKRAQEAEVDKAREAYRNKRLFEAAGHTGASLLPMFGPLAANIGEQMGTGDVGGGLTRAGTYALIPKAAGKVIGGVAHEMTPEALRTRASVINTKALKTAEAGAKDFGKSAGYQVAKERIVTGAREAPTKIESARIQKAQQVVQLTQQLDRQGVTLDPHVELEAVTREAARIANERGQWTPQVKNQVNSMINRLTTQTDPKTGQVVPRDLTKLTTSQALQLTRGLEDPSAFGKEAPTLMEHLSRRLRGAINDKLDLRIQKLRGEESSLIKARDAAKENYAKILNDNMRVVKSLWSGGAGPIAFALALREVGAGYVAAMGSIVMLRALFQSMPSRTFRAALYVRAADMMDKVLGPQSASKGAIAGPQAAVGGPQGGGAPQLPPGAPMLPQRGVGPQAPPSGASQPTAGPQATPPTPPHLAASYGPPKADFAGKVPAENLGFDPNPPKDFGAQARVDVERRMGGSLPRGAKEQRGVVNGAESNTKMKAMLDRLDTLMERQEHPKSGADRVAVNREIKELKKIVGGEAQSGKGGGTGRSEAGRITRRISQRESLAGKRAEAASTEQSQVSRSGDPVSQAASPETRVLALDAGYKALEKYEGGAEMVKALRGTAKAMQKIDPSYDEVEKLTEALTVLKQLGMSGGDLK